MSSSPFEIGSIVALKSHPYLKDLTSITLSGEPNLLSPLMVVIEVMKYNRNVPEDPSHIIHYSSYQCKCLWYSHIACQFEEAWISSFLLKPIDFGSEIATIENLIPERFVALKTMELELGKLKSSLDIEGNSISVEKKTKITSLLSFLSPVMQVLEIKRNESKTAKSQKKEDQTRQISKWSVKCKWFNFNGNKFSEKFLPIEALCIIPPINSDILLKINRSIEKGTYLKIIMNNAETIVKPISISHKSGLYYLKSYDYIRSKVIETYISPNILVDETEKLFTNKSPKFESVFNGNGLSSEIIRADKVSAIKNAISKQAYIRIKYKCWNGRLTTRTIKEYSIKTNHQTNIDYLFGHCMLREQERIFKIDRIISIRELCITYEKKDLTMLTEPLGSN